MVMNTLLYEFVLFCGGYKMRLRDEMPEMSGATLWYNSRPLGRNDLIGRKPTLFHFWSVSCVHCKISMPTINQLRDDYQDVLNVIAVHMPRTKKDLDLELVKNVAKEHNINQPIYVDNDHTLTDAFGNHAVPAYYIFDYEGKLRHIQTGKGRMVMLKKRIDRILRYDK